MVKGILRRKSKTKAGQSSEDSKDLSSEVKDMEEEGQSEEERKIPVQDLDEDKFEEESLESDSDQDQEEVEVKEEDSKDDVLELSKKESRKNYDKYIRAVAELENFKRRSIKERSDLLKYAGENIARDFIEIVDHLELAVGQKNAGTAEDILKGVKLILDQSKQALEKHSISSEESVGKNFDPNKQQAVAMVPTSDHKDGTVIEEFKKAYHYKDKLLRPAQVVVAKAPEEPEASTDKKEEEEE